MFRWCLIFIGFYRSTSRDRKNRDNVDHSRTSGGSNYTNYREKENVSWRANSNERYNKGSRNNSLERWHAGKSSGGGVGDRQRRNSSSERHRQGGGTRQTADRRGQYRNGSRERRDRLNRSRRNSNDSRYNQTSEEISNWRNELRPASTLRNEYNAGTVAVTPSSPGGNVSSSSSVTVSEEHKPPGILVLPNSTVTSTKSPSPNKEQPVDVPSYPVYRGNIQRQLFNPNNPNEPIIVAAGGNRVAAHLQKDGGQMMQSGQPNPDNRYENK